MLHKSCDIGFHVQEREPGPASSVKKIEAVATKKNIFSEHLESKITDMMKF